MLLNKKMNNTCYSLQFDDLRIHVQRKAVKNLRLVVKTTGEVRVSAPWFVPKILVQQFVGSRLDWIREQQDIFAQQPASSRIEMLSGETHLVQGKPYVLNVIEKTGRSRVELVDHAIMHLIVPSVANREQRLAVLDTYYRKILQREIPVLIAKWQPLMKVEVKSWGVRKMKSRWGSCNTTDRRILLSLELAKHSPECMEYVMVHEMVHLLEPSHNQRFKRLMDCFLPNWKMIKDELNSKV